MKRNIFTAAAIAALLLLNAAVPVCSAAPDEVLDEAGVSYVMSGFKAYYLEDGVYYHNQGASADEYGAAVEIPPGEYHVTFKLLALSATYPEGKFAVRFKTDGGPDMFGAPESNTSSAGKLTYRRSRRGDNRGKTGDRVFKLSVCGTDSRSDK